MKYSIFSIGSSLLIMCSNISYAGCYHRDIPSHECRYLAGDSWCYENHEINPYAYRDSCMNKILEMGNSIFSDEFSLRKNKNPHTKINDKEKLFISLFNKYGASHGRRCQKVGFGIGAALLGLTGSYQCGLINQPNVQKSSLSYNFNMGTIESISRHLKRGGDNGAHYSTEVHGIPISIYFTNNFFLLHLFLNQRILYL